MKSISIVSNVAAGFTLTFTMLTSLGSTSATAKIPVLMELFTSEGCSSCPPADRLLASLDQKQPEARAELIVLSEHVDYFNSLGWRDPFSAKVFTDRQESFSRTLHSDGAYTPQLVVDGRFGFVGSDQAAASAAIRKALQEPKIPLNISRVTRLGGQVTLRVESAGDRSSKTANGLLFAALADEQLESRVLGGENGGHVLRHVGVVRILKSATTMDLHKPAATKIAMPLQPEWGANGLRVVVFIQDPISGHVLGAEAQKVKP